MTYPHKTKSPPLASLKARPVFCFVPRPALLALRLWQKRPKGYVNITASYRATQQSTRFYDEYDGQGSKEIIACLQAVPYKSIMLNSHTANALLIFEIRCYLKTRTIGERITLKPDPGKISQLHPQ